MAFSLPVRETDLSSGVCIVAPPGPTYQVAAKRLQAVLEEAVSAEVEILPDATDEIGGRHAVAVGNMMDSAFLRALYFRAYDLTDFAWPGPGGWAIRTVPYSVERVGHVIVVGVSLEEDAPRAAEVLSGEIARGGRVLPFQHRVEPGRWAHLFLDPARERLKKGDAALEREFTSGPGDWTYMWAISEIGVLAVQTGLDELMRMFCRQVCEFARTRWFERHLPDPPQIHGFLRTMLLPFAMVEHHPGISDGQRAETLEAFLGMYRSTEGAGNPGFLNHVGVDQVRQNHQTMSGLDLFYGGRYFHQVHGLAEGLGWMKLAEVFFAPQMRSNKPVCDSWGHQWAFSLFNTADYALASGKMAYFSSAPFLEGVDRALMAHSSLEGGPLQYFLMAAAVTGNDEYLQLCRTSDAEDLAKRALRREVEPLRAWVTGRQAAEPRRLGRVKAAPLSRLFYDSIEHSGGFAPRDVYLRDTPFEATFDKVFFRSGWSVADDYLLLDGISGGSHSYQDGNCIVRYTSRGKSWFGGRVGFGPGSVREHVGVSVAVDGAGPGCESRYAALRYLCEGERLAAAGTSMHYPEQAHGFRHVVHGMDGWFLVVDEMRADREGEFLIEARWHVFGEVELKEGILISTQGDARLTMRHAGCAVQDLAPVAYAHAKGGTLWTQRSMVRLRPGEVVRFATLFWSDGSDGLRDFSLVPEVLGYRIEGGGSKAEIVLAEEEDRAKVGADRAVLAGAGRASEASDPAPFHIPKGGATPAWRGTCNGAVISLDAAGDRCCAGDEEGGIAAFDREGEILWRQNVPGAVRTVLALEDGGVVAGGEGEKVYRLDASGNEVWAKQLVWQPMNWDYWTWKNVQVLSLAAGDLDGDGKLEVLAGCADRHIYVFDDSGSLLWRSACQWGPPTCLGLARMEEGKALHVLAGMADPAIHGCVRVYDARGACVKTLSRPDILSWSIPSWCRCLRAADVEGDGWAEAVCGVDTNHRQLIVYRREGEILWDADLGSAVLAVEVRDGRVYAGAANGFVQCFSGEGRRLWSRFLAAPVVGLAPVGSGGCQVALRGGAVVELDGDGEVWLSGHIGAETKAAAWGGLGAGRGLVAGSSRGEVVCYGSDQE